jgi:hypothetical protein
MGWAKRELLERQERECAECGDQTEGERTDKACDRCGEPRKLCPSCVNEEASGQPMRTGALCDYCRHVMDSET